MINTTAQRSSQHQSCHCIFCQHHPSGAQQSGSDTLKGTETGVAIDCNYHVLSIMYKSLYGLGSATHSCASYSLSAPSQHVATYSHRQCFSTMPWGDIKGFFFLWKILNSCGWKNFQRNKMEEKPFCISHWHLNSCLTRTRVNSFLFHSAL